MARFMGPTWGPSGADQVGPMLAPWTLLSGYINQIKKCSEHFSLSMTLYAIQLFQDNGKPHNKALWLTLFRHRSNISWKKTHRKFNNVYDTIISDPAKVSLQHVSKYIIRTFKEYKLRTRWTTIWRTFVKLIGTNRTHGYLLFSVGRFLNLQFSSHVLT